MRFKILSLIAVIGLVAACGTAPKKETAATSGQGTETVAAGSQQDLVVNVGDRVHFCFDCYDLTPEARATLQKQAAWMKANASTNITIEGHCDERGTREYNLALGHRRANAVYDYLVTLGVPADRMSTISYGKERPQFAESNEIAWAANRRAVTVVK
jgi:peptidoglycan-associated lipoprotein